MIEWLEQQEQEFLKKYNCKTIEQVLEAQDKILKEKEAQPQ